ncbi:MAG: HPr kinase/phosphorylase [Lactobacillus sp.]|uniref:HPr(Ser) kinase/phosphatase n=1 Tax=Bombilactobacillus bombi TaxID=1303590 RepID=UPI000E576BC1|nr:HPr(Ser) kinase/phosphatase [Bombilactobacillus bombi]AXX64805.1 HPr kinase/phosphorylase [Bombilactobacillus bombi]MCO6543285.1 HPr kinase/phosphorylase [Lactobacillus sp.]
MGKNIITVQDLINNTNIEVYYGQEYLAKRPIVETEISRPGLELTGYFDYYPYERVQLFGQTETSYAKAMTPKNRYHVLTEMCTDKTPAFVFSRGIQPSLEMRQAANEHQIPILGSPLTTTRVSNIITQYLEKVLAERQSIHGVLVDVYGLGVLIKGDSGIGKSETALELVKNGHRLVADDRVDIFQQNEHTLVGEAPEILKNLMEVRGIGIIDVMNLFGASAVRTSMEISLIMNLKNWSPNENYERIGLDDNTEQIFDVVVPSMTIPVKVGRNIANIIEVAAMDYRAKKMGYDAAARFEENLTGLIKKNSESDANK